MLVLEGEGRLDDERLLCGLKEKQRDAFEEIIEGCHPYVCTIVYQVCGGSIREEDLEEVVSDVFLSLWNHGAAIDESKGTLRSYLGAIARNRAKNWLRKTGREPVLEHDELTLGRIAGASGASDPESAILRDELTELLRMVVEEMEEPDREIFLRHYYRWETIAGIARCMGMNPSTVKTKLARGRGRLRVQLEKRGYYIEDTDF